MSSAPTNFAIAALIGQKGINFRGPFNPVTVYSIGDAVSYSGSSYYSVSYPNTGNQPNTDPGTNWQPLALGGQNFLGPWSSTIAYVTGSIVTYVLSGQTTTYWALSPTTNVNPSTDGGVHWAIIAQGGRGSYNQGHFATSASLPPYNGTTVINTDYATVGSNSELWIVVSGAWADQGVQFQGGAGTRGGVNKGHFSSSANLPTVDGVNTINGDFATVGANSEAWTVVSGAWADSGVQWQGPTGPSTGQTISRFICIGDSYTDNGNNAYFASGWNFNTSGESFISNGPSWFSLLSKIYGFSAIPRWGNVPAGGNNYAIASADVDSAPTWSGTTYDMIYQVTTYLADVSNVVPSNTLIIVWIGINTCRNAYGSYVGAHDATDPLGTCPAFTMPNAGSTVTISMSTFNDATIAVNDVLWIAVAGYMKATAISGGNITLNNINAAGNAAGGTPIPLGGNVRWGSLAYLDSEMMKYVAQINSLVSAGATKILVLTTPNVAANAAQGGGAGSSEYVSFGNIAAYWNAQLASQMAAISSTLIQVFDTASIFSSVIANPYPYGFTNADSGLSTDPSNGLAGWNPDQYLWFDNLHPSAAMHRIIANKAIPAINNFVGGYTLSQQLSLATQGFGISEPNSVLPSPDVFVPTGSTLARGVNPFPTGLNLSDIRLSYLSRLLDQPNLKTEIAWDYQESLSSTLSVPPGCPYNSVNTKVGSAGLQYWGSPSQYNGNGMRWMNTIALNDLSGDLFTGVPFLSPANSGNGGQLMLIWRATNVLASGDTIVATMGLMDSQTSLQNGCYWQLTNASGVITANFVVLKAGTVEYTISLGTVAWPSAGNNVTFKAITDFNWLRWHFYIGGSYVTSSPVMVTSNLPTAPIFAGHMVTKTVNAASGQSYLLLDLFKATHLNYRRQ